MRPSAILCLILSLWTATSHGQDYLYATGSPAFSTQMPIDHGFVQINNGEIHLEIPIALTKQRGDFTLAERFVYDSRIWKLVANGSSYTWAPSNVPGATGGWTFRTGLGGGTLTMITGRGTDSHTYACGGGPAQGPNSPPQTHTYSDYYSWVWIDPSGTSHSFPSVETVKYGAPSGDCNPPQNLPNAPSSSGVASDGSGYTLALTNYTTAVITDLRGTTYYPGTPTVVDRNGNTVGADSSGNLIDTSQNTPVIATTNGNTTYYDVLGAAGARQRYTVTFTSISYNTSFKQTGVPTEASGSFNAIQSIGLPDGSSYRFTYNSGSYGDLATMTLPTGGVIQYNYSNFLDSFNNQNRWLTSIVKDGGTTTFAPAALSTCTSSAGCQENVTVTSPDLNDLGYTFLLDKAGLIAGSSWNSVITAYQGRVANRQPLQTTFTSFTYNTYPSYSYQSGSYVNRGTYQTPATTNETLQLSDAGISKRTLTTFMGLVTLPIDIKVSDWYATSQGPPTAPALEKFYNYSNGYPTAISLKDGSGTLLSATTFGYDEVSTTAAPSNTPNHTVGINSHNQTTQTVYVNTGNTSLSSHYTYYDTGQVKTVADPSGGTTSYGYDASGTYVTSTTMPIAGLATSAAFDPYTGVPIGITDLNGTTTNYANYDGLNRPQQITITDSGGNLVGKTLLTYTATSSQEQVYQSPTVASNTITLLDAYGRTSRVAVANGESSNPWYQQDTCYDANGRVKFSSYQYVGPGFGAAAVCSGNGDSFGYDGLGRTSNVTSPDGTVQITRVGPATLVKDKNNLQKITQVDGFGRPLFICEVSGTKYSSDSPGSCGLDIPGSGYLTTYAYSFPSLTTTVTQGVQTRSFQSDSLGRPISVTEPERGTTTYGYTYNATGLLTTRTRPRANEPAPSPDSTVTTTQYDLLGRVLTVGYSEGSTTYTPTRYFQYDTAIPGGTIVNAGAIKGRLSYSHNDNHGSSYQYDALGRLSETVECVADWCSSPVHNIYRFYSYDWTGNLKMDRYATSGNAQTNAAAYATITYGYNVAGQLTTIRGGQSDAAGNPNIYGVDPTSMLPFGPQTETYGNGLIASTQYDNLGRLQGRWLCGGTGGVNCPGGPYYYGMVAQRAGNQVQWVVDTVLNRFTDFAYDDLGRLASSATHPNSGYTGLSMSSTYDRYGNHLSESVSNTGGYSPNLSFPTLPQNNRIQGYQYDGAGNLLNDGIDHFVYDAENNQLAISGGATGTYVYNEFNQRVKASSGTTVDRYGLDAAGRRSTTWLDGTATTLKRMQYYGTNGPVAFWSATDGHIHFEHQDYLGTDRMITGSTGTQEGTIASLPYGEIAFGQGSDENISHFALLDQDVVSNPGLLHAGSREYSAGQGRWLSADPYDGSYDPGDPQSLNRYSYVGSNPLGLVDPSGQDGQGPISVGGGLGGCVGAIYSGGENYGADIGCGISLIKDLFDLFSQPKFKGTLKPRPNAQPWDEKEFPVQFGPDIAGALGLPTPQCEFGVCGFTDGQDVGSTARSLIPSLFISFPYRDLFDSNHRLFGTHYCGPGGGGSETNQLDHLCHVHDDCYAQFGVDANVNNPGHHTGLDRGQVIGLATCNQALYDEAGAIKSIGAEAVRVWLKLGFGFLYPGTEAQ